MKVPLITVLMPAYNAEKYIGEAIGSVLNQSFTDFELLIINDGSADATEKIIRSFTDDRIRLINQTNKGVSAALNMGLLNANAELIARFDADDICLPQRLEKQFNFFKENPGYVLVGSDAEYVDMNGEFVFTFEYSGYSDEEIRNLPYQVCPFSHPTVMYKKDLVIAAGMYDINAHNFEDHLLWRKMIQLGKVCNLKENLIKYRFNPGSVTIDERWRGERFAKLKYDAIKNGYIDKETGKEILDILANQDTARIKEGSYYSLLSKKYLFNNYDIAKARRNIGALIKTNPLKLQGYMLLALTLFPRPVLKKMYKVNKSAYAKAT